MANWLRLIQDIWKILILAVIVLMEAQAVNFKGVKGKPPALVQRLQLLQQGNKVTKRPSLTKAFQILQPAQMFAASRAATQRGLPALSIAAVSKKNLQRTLNRKVYPKNNKAIIGIPFRPLASQMIGNKSLKKTIRLTKPSLGKKPLNTVKGTVGRNVKAPIRNLMEDPSAKRQKLWYPGDQLGGPLPQFRTSDGIQRALAINDKPMFVTDMKIGPGQSLTTNQIYSKLHQRHFKPNALLQRQVSIPVNSARFQPRRPAENDPKGYVNTVSLLLHEDGVNEDFNIGGTTLNSPYAATSYMYGDLSKQKTQQRDYFGPVLPEVARQEQGYSRSMSSKKHPVPITEPLASKLRSKQSNIEKIPPGMENVHKNTFADNSWQGRDKLMDNAINQTVASSALRGMANEKTEPLEMRKGDDKSSSDQRITSSSLEQADTENRKEATKKEQTDPRWEKLQQEKNERWNEYQREKEARWKNMEGNSYSSGNVAVPAYDTGMHQSGSSQRFGINSGQSVNQPSHYEGAGQGTNIDNYDYKYFTTSQEDSKGSYDYSTDRKPGKQGFGQNTEEISPNGGTIGNINVSPEDKKPTGTNREIKIGNQSKILNLEVVDKPDKPLPAAETKKPEPEKGGEPDKGEPEKGEPEKGGPEKGEPEKGGIPEKGMPEKGGVPEKGLPEKGGVTEKGEPEKGGIPEKGMPEKGGIPEKGMPEKGGVPEKGLPEKGGVPEKGLPEKGCKPEKGGEMEKPETECVPVGEGKPEKGGVLEKGEPEKECVEEKVGEPTPKLPLEGKTNNEKCVKKPEKPKDKEQKEETKPPETVETLVEQSLLDRMEKKLASILSLMEYAGGIHTIEIVSSGCDDPPANKEDCRKALGTITVDGEMVSEDEFGFNIVVIDYPSFKVKTVKNYDTNMDGAKSQKLASFLMSLQGTNIILVAAKGDVAGAVGQDVWDTLTIFGARPPFEKGRRASFAFIGCRGKCQLPWIQQVQRPAGHGPSTIQLIVGVNREYVSFGGGGPVVFDAIKTVGKGSSMSEGYNAGLPSKIAPDQVVPEQMAREVPHLPHEMMSNQEIIPDIGSSKEQKDAATFLNRHEAGEIGLGREVPMQAADKTAPYGRGLHYMVDAAQQSAYGIEEGTKELAMQNSTNKLIGNNFHEPLPMENVHRVTNYYSNDGTSAGRKVSGIEEHNLEAIPTEAEADNEPFPEDVMSIASQMRPLDAAEVARKVESQNAEHVTKQQETSRMSSSYSNEETAGKSNGHYEGHEYKQNERPVSQKEESARDSKTEASLQAHDGGEYRQVSKLTSTSPKGNAKLLDSNEHLLRATEGDRSPSTIEKQSQQELKKDNHDFHGTTESRHSDSNHQYIEKPLCKHCDITPEVTFKLKGSDLESGPSNCKGCSNPNFTPEVDNLGMNMSVTNKIVSPTTVQTSESESKWKTEGNNQRDSAHKTFKEDTDFKHQDSSRQQSTYSGEYRQVSKFITGPKGNAKLLDANEHLLRATEEDRSPFTTEKQNQQELKKNNHDFHGTTESHHSDSNHQFIEKPLCKHCDIKPEVTFKLEGSDMESGPSNCKGCGNPNFTPEVDNLGMNMSVTNKIVSPTTVQTSKEEMKQPAPVPLHIKETIQDNREKQSTSITENGQIGSHVAWEQKKPNKNFIQNDKSTGDGSMPNMKDTSNQMFAISQNKLLLLNDAPRNEQIMKFAGGREDVLGAQKHNAERPENGPQNAFRQDSMESKEISSYKDSTYGSRNTTRVLSMKDAPTTLALAPLATSMQAHHSSTNLAEISTGNHVNDVEKVSANGRDPVNPSQNERVTAPLNVNVQPSQDNGEHKMATTGRFQSSPPQFQKGMDAQASAPVKAKINAYARENAENTPENVPAAFRTHDTAENEKPTNITTLVEIISKGMKALRESNIEIDGDKKLAVKNDKESASDSKTKEEQKSEDKNKQAMSRGKDAEKERGNAFPVAAESQHAVSKMVKGSHESSNDNEIGALQNALGNSGLNTGRQSNPGEEFDVPKHGWHDKNCDKNPELCKGVKSMKQEYASKNQNDKVDSSLEKILSKGVSDLKTNKMSPDCENFYSLPERQKRRFTRTQIEKYKKTCLQHEPRKLEPLNVADIKNDDEDSLAPFAHGQKPKLGVDLQVSNHRPLATNIDKLNINSAKLKIASLLKQESMSKPDSDYHPGYTTMAFPHGAVIAEKKLGTMPDTSETFISRTARPDFAAMTAENSGKPSDMAFYFSQKNDQRTKDMLMRALPETRATRPETSSLTNTYDQGGVYQMAENLLQKDYAMAYNEASAALNQRVANEQKRLNDQKLSIIAKRRLKKTRVNKPGIDIKNKVKLNGR